MSGLKPVSSEGTYLGSFGENDPKNDKELILGEDHCWVPCRICERAFSRLRLTGRYCDICKAGVCEGEHGNFSNHVFICVICRGPVVRTNQDNAIPTASKPT